MKKHILKVLSMIPDYLFNWIVFVIKLRYIPNFKKPRSLNEKINHIKLYSNYSLRETVADRIKVRNYVSIKDTECKLIDLLWEGNEFTLDTYNGLPNKFVIKANHGSGMVSIVDKTETSYKDVLKIIMPWMGYDYGKLTHQWVYENLEKKFIIEEFIESDEDLRDYKFFCINGRVELVQVDLDRFHSHKRNLYTRDFELLDSELFYKKGHDIDKPNLFLNAVKVAEKLSEDFDFIRVDLYILDDVIYFGEMTNTPGNGFEFFNPRSFDFELGRKIKFIKETY